MSHLTLIFAIKFAKDPSGIWLILSDIDKVL